MVKFIALLIFTALFIITFICFLLYLYFTLITSKQIEKEIQLKQEQRTKTEINLNQKLINLCSLFSIPLEYKNDLGTAAGHDLGTAAGHILYHQDRKGRIFLDNCKIEVLEKYQNEPWVLAHEIGHYIAMNKLQDDTEEMADQMANELCCTLLSENEIKDLEIGLKVYFKQEVRR